MFEAFDTDYRSWSYWIWFLHAFALYCGVGFAYFWIRLHALQRAAADGMPQQVARYRRAMQGFPNSVFAKMMGMSPEDVPEDGTRPRKRS